MGAKKYKEKRKLSIEKIFFFLNLLSQQGFHLLCLKPYLLIVNNVFIVYSIKSINCTNYIMKTNIKKLLTNHHKRLMIDFKLRYRIDTFQGSSIYIIEWRWETLRVGFLTFFKNTTKLWIRFIAYRKHLLSPCCIHHISN